MSYRRVHTLTQQQIDQKILFEILKDIIELSIFQWMIPHSIERLISIIYYHFTQIIGPTWYVFYCHKSNSKIFILLVSVMKEKNINDLASIKVVVFLHGVGIILCI